MKTGQTPASASTTPAGFPDADSLAALRGWYAGLSSRAAVEHYLAARKAAGQSARGMLGNIRRDLMLFADSRHRPDFAAVFQHTPEERRARASAVERAIKLLPTLPVPQPQISDAIDAWLAPRTVRALQAHGIRTLSDLTVRIPRRRGWWKAIEGLGMAGARQVEAFFAAHPQLTERARALIIVAQPSGIVPWEQLHLPGEVDGSRGSFRAPRNACTLNAT
uniref:phage integrase family protein n=1 Tax=Cupriavidus sp. UYPR2.512 TaxID=1080187 RepID=UPI0005656BCB